MSFWRTCLTFNDYNYKDCKSDLEQLVSNYIQQLRWWERRLGMILNFTWRNAILVKWGHSLVECCFLNSSKKWMAWTCFSWAGPNCCTTNEDSWIMYVTYWQWKTPTTPWWRVKDHMTHAKSLTFYEVRRSFAEGKLFTLLKSTPGFSRQAILCLNKKKVYSVVWLLISVRFAVFSLVWIRHIQIRLFFYTHLRYYMR